LVPGHTHTSPSAQSPGSTQPATQTNVVVSQIWPTAHCTSAVQSASSMQFPVAVSQNSPDGQSSEVEHPTCVWQEPAGLQNCPVKHWEFDAQPQRP
jgi:hypothetical protein